MFVRTDRSALASTSLILTSIFTPWVDRATGAFIWPLLGLIFLPLTTLLYVILWNTDGRGVDGLGVDSGHSRSIR
jgi:hypothetical protein